MAIMWSSQDEQQAARQDATEIAWRMFLVQTLTGRAGNVERQAGAAEDRHDPMVGPDREHESLEKRAA